MLNKLRQLIRRYEMLQPGDHVVCAVSGGADSVALLFAMYLLRERLEITLSAAHFNHGLRGAESDRDEEFVRRLCDRLDIPLSVGSGTVVAGKKGLEAAAREARYGFFRTLSGKIATAHTADDNLETVLMHLVRGTGLKGLGGIAPVNGNLIRPMLEVTRAEVLAFLEEYHLSYVTDSTNAQDLFFRNRLRRQIIPLLEKENPNLAVSVTALAQRLRQDEQVLQEQISAVDVSDVPTLRRLKPALRRRAVCHFLREQGIREPEAKHILGVEKLIFSDKPSARMSMHDGLVISREYDRLAGLRTQWRLEPKELQCPGETVLPQLGLCICCQMTPVLSDTDDSFTVVPAGKLFVRHRLPGDRIRLAGGTKDLKKLFIDQKIPASLRLRIPVLADDLGVVGVYGFGPNRDRLSTAEGAVRIGFKTVEKKEEEDR